jgi:hypothetical protein
VFLDDLLRGICWVGYDRLEHSEVIEEFLSRPFAESPDNFVDTLNQLIKAHYWYGDAYPKHSAETLTLETIYQFAKLVNNVVGTMEE